MNPPAVTGYAVPCPTFALNASSVPQSGTLVGTIMPTASAIQYIYTTGYVYNGSSWLPEAIVGSSPYAGYSNVVSTLKLSTSVLSSLPLGPVYLVEWDWTWNPTQQCYLGPGTSVCNEGSWRLQQFSLTQGAPLASLTIFTTQTPGFTGVNNGVNYELGSRFTASVPGGITAIRFWKDVNESGSHVGNLWDANGNLLASVAFSNESAFGWQQQNLSNPYAISANTTYTVSVNTTNNYFVYSLIGTNTPVVNQSLQTISGNYGAYISGFPGSYPASSAQNNYFRDIVFASSSAASPTPTPTPTPSPSGSGGPYSVTNQQPVSQRFYQGTFWTKLLPADAINHLYNNGYASSDQIVKHMFSNSDNPSAFGVGCAVFNLWTGTPCSTSSGNDSFYYAQQSDPIYKYNGTTGCPGGPNSTAANCLSYKYFHAPRGARFDATPVTAGDDRGIQIWDQSTDIDPTSGGRIISGYSWGLGALTLNSSCTCETTACADTTPACQLSGWAYGSINYPFATDPSKAWGIGTTSDGSPNAAYLVRQAEVMQDQINHTLGAGTACVATDVSPVFPAAPGDILHCTADDIRPSNGNLFFIDSAYNCDAQSGGQYLLMGWQRPYCHAMQKYGAYLHSTTGGTTTGLGIQALEGGYAYVLAGASDYFYTDWLLNNAAPPALTWNSSEGLWYGGPWVGGNLGAKLLGPSGISSPKPVQKTLLWIMQMPGLITGQGAAASNDGKVHLHIADSCVAKALAGVSGGCP